MPFLLWHSPNKFLTTKAKKIMSDKVVYVRMKESVENIVNILKNTSHHGFPVVDQIDEINCKNGRLRGFMLRSQLIVILKRSFFEESKRFWEQTVSIDTFRDDYPRFSSIDDVKLSKLSHKYTINMEIFMNPSPYIVNQLTSVPKAFTLFRTLGLRHLVVTDDDNHVTGIITRKDFLK